MPMEREIESLNVKNEEKKKNHFAAEKSWDFFFVPERSALIFTFQSNQVKQTCTFETTHTHTRKWMTFCC